MWTANRGVRLNGIQWKRFAQPPLGVDSGRSDGKRLLPLTRRIAGDDRPKQFCAVLGNETLLQQTQRRTSRLVQSWRTSLVLTKAHEPFYADEVAGIPSSRLLIQPSNRGTAPAILYRLLRLCEMDPRGVVAFFPSDHHFSDDEAFIGHIDSAYAAAAFRPEMVILWAFHPKLRKWSTVGSSPASLWGVLRQQYLSREPLLGETLWDACLGLDGAWLSVEQLRYGWPRSSFPKPHTAHASRPGRSV